MGLLIQPDLTLDCARSPGAWVPKTIRDFLADVATIGDVSERILNLEAYVHRLQDEMNKIDPFKKELPLTMVLLADVIFTVKEELLQCQRSNAEPVLEEFIPLKKTSTDDENNDRWGEAKENDAANSKDKMDWMSSVQLWSSDVHNHPTTDYLTNCKLSPKNPENSNNKKKRKEEAVSDSSVDDLFPSGKNRTAGRTFKGCTNFPVMVDELPDLPALSLRMPEMKEEKVHSGGFRSISNSTKSVSSPAINAQQQSSRKQRRCWSPELHRRFVNALQQLGGPQAATPKQIRELMQVDGLTNDEVKSHLQKYRLHTRKLPPTANSEQPALLWMPREASGESSKPSNLQSSSPQDTPGPPGAGGNSTSAGDSGVEDEDDDKLESRISDNEDV